jgi:hypothetical protein
MELILISILILIFVLILSCCCFIFILTYIELGTVCLFPYMSRTDPFENTIVKITVAA